MKERHKKMIRRCVYRHTSIEHMFANVFLDCRLLFGVVLILPVVDAVIVVVVLVVVHERLVGEKCPVRLVLTVATFDAPQHNKLLTHKTQSDQCKFLLVDLVTF